MAVWSKIASDRDALPDFMAELEDDPLLAIRWRKAIGAKMRDISAPNAGGGSNGPRGGRFAYRLDARQRIGNAIRAPQAVVKIVRGGGAGSARDLASQLTYLSRDGELALDEYEPDGLTFDLQGTSEIKGLAHAWAERWERAEALDGRAARSKAKTYHMIVSFPEGADIERAHNAADTFADRFLTSGELGDRWSHIRAWHTDRAHPHMHLVIDRRGESGLMMQVNPAREISPARLRGLQVDAAAEHGLLLNDTPRVSRGLRGQGLSSHEWRAEERGNRIGRGPRRRAYETLTSSFADETLRQEAQELRDLARKLDAAATLHPSQQHEQRFAPALLEAAATLESGKDLSLMQPQSLEEDRKTLDALASMSVQDLADTMHSAVIEAEQLAPTLKDETRRAALEVETGRIRELYAPYVPEFEAALEPPRLNQRTGGLSTVIDARDGVGHELENTPVQISRDDDSTDLGPEPERPRPQRTLSDADARVLDAYDARGMNGERALARIKGGLKATKETRDYWQDQEVRERMRVGDLPRTEAEREIKELHGLAVGMYRAASRAIERGVSLEAAEIEAPRDPLANRGRALEHGFEVDQDIAAPPPDAVPEASSRDLPQTMSPAEPGRSSKPTRAEFLKQLEDQERALLKADAERARERGIENAPDLDDGFDL